MNAAKAQIDALSSRLATSPGGQQADGVIDAEHHQLTAQLKAAKATYRRRVLARGVRLVSERNHAQTRA